MTGPIERTSHSSSPTGTAPGTPSEHETRPVGSGTLDAHGRVDVSNAPRLPQRITRQASALLQQGAQLGQNLLTATSGTLAGLKRSFSRTSSPSRSASPSSADTQQIREGTSHSGRQSKRRATAPAPAPVLLDVRYRLNAAGKLVTVSGLVEGDQFVLYDSRGQETGRLPAAHTYVHESVALRAEQQALDRTLDEAGKRFAAIWPDLRDGVPGSAGDEEHFPDMTVRFLAAVAHSLQQTWDAMNTPFTPARAEREFPAALATCVETVKAQRTRGSKLPRELHGFARRPATFPTQLQQAWACFEQTGTALGLIGSRLWQLCVPPHMVAQLQAAGLCASPLLALVCNAKGNYLAPMAQAWQKLSGQLAQPLSVELLLDWAATCLGCQDLDDCFSSRGLSVSLTVGCNATPNGIKALKKRIAELDKMGVTITLEPTGNDAAGRPTYRFQRAYVSPEKLKEVMAQLIARYQRSIDQAVALPDPEERHAQCLAAAARLSQMLLCLHPLRDGNIHVMCMLLPVFLLARQGQAAGVPHNPNLLLGCTQGEAVKALAQAQDWSAAHLSQDLLFPLREPFRFNEVLQPFADALDPSRCAGKVALVGDVRFNKLTRDVVWALLSGRLDRPVVALPTDKQKLSLKNHLKQIGEDLKADLQAMIAGQVPPSSARTYVDKVDVRKMLPHERPLLQGQLGLFASMPLKRMYLGIYSGEAMFQQEQREHYEKHYPQGKAVLEQYSIQVGYSQRNDAKTYQSVPGHSGSRFMRANTATLPRGGYDFSRINGVYVDAGVSFLDKEGQRQDLFVSVLVVKPTLAAHDQILMEYGADFVFDSLTGAAQEQQERQASLASGDDAAAMQIDAEVEVDADAEVDAEVETEVDVEVEAEVKVSADAGAEAHLDPALVAQTADMDIDATDALVHASDVQATDAQAATTDMDVDTLSDRGSPASAQAQTYEPIHEQTYEPTYEPTYEKQPQASAQAGTPTVPTAFVTPFGRYYHAANPDVGDDDGPPFHHKAYDANNCAEATVETVLHGRVQYVPDQTITLGGRTEVVKAGSFYNELKALGILPQDARPGQGYGMRDIALLLTHRHDKPVRYLASSLTTLTSVRDRLAVALDELAAADRPHQAAYDALAAQARLLFDGNTGLASHLSLHTARAQLEAAVAQVFGRHDSAGDAVRQQYRRIFAMLEKNLAPQDRLLQSLDHAARDYCVLQLRGGGDYDDVEHHLVFRAARDGSQYLVDNRAATLSPVSLGQYLNTALAQGNIHGFELLLPDDGADPLLQWLNQEQMRLAGDPQCEPTLVDYGVGLLYDDARKRLALDEVPLPSSAVVRPQGQSGARTPVQPAQPTQTEKTVQTVQTPPATQAAATTTVARLIELDRNQAGYLLRGDGESDENAVLAALAQRLGMGEADVIDDAPQAQATMASVASTATVQEALQHTGSPVPSTNDLLDLQSIKDEVLAFRQERSALRDFYPALPGMTKVCEVLEKKYKYQWKKRVAAALAAPPRLLKPTKIVDTDWCSGTADKPAGIYLDGRRIEIGADHQAALDVFMQQRGHHDGPLLPSGRYITDPNDRFSESSVQAVAKAWFEPFTDLQWYRIKFGSSGGWSPVRLFRSLSLYALHAEGLSLDRCLNLRRRHVSDSLLDTLDFSQRAKEYLSLYFDATEGAPDDYLLQFSKLTPNEGDRFHQQNQQFAQADLKKISSMLQEAKQESAKHKSVKKEELKKEELKWNVTSPPVRKTQYSPIFSDPARLKQIKSRIETVREQQLPEQAFVLTVPTERQASLASGDDAAAMQIDAEVEVDADAEVEAHAGAHAGADAHPDPALVAQTGDMDVDATDALVHASDVQATDAQAATTDMDVDTTSDRGSPASAHATAPMREQAQTYEPIHDEADVTDLTMTRTMDTLTIDDAPPTMTRATAVPDASERTGSPAIAGDNLLDLQGIKTEVLARRQQMGRARELLPVIPDMKTICATLANELGTKWPYRIIAALGAPPRMLTNKDIIDTEWRNASPDNPAGIYLKGRRIEIGAEHQEALDEYLKVRGRYDGPFITNLSGVPATTQFIQQFSRIWLKASSRLPGIMNDFNANVRTPRDVMRTLALYALHAEGLTIEQILQLRRRDIGDGLLAILELSSETKACLSMHYNATQGMPDDYLFAFSAPSGQVVTRRPAEDFKKANAALDKMTEKLEKFGANQTLAATVDTIQNKRVSKYDPIFERPERVDAIRNRIQMIRNFNIPERNFISGIPNEQRLHDALVRLYPDNVWARAIGAFLMPPETLKPEEIFKLKWVPGKDANNGHVVLGDREIHVKPSFQADLDSCLDLRGRKEGNFFAGLPGKKLDRGTINMVVTQMANHFPMLRPFIRGTVYGVGLSLASTLRNVAMFMLDCEGVDIGDSLSLRRHDVTSGQINTLGLSTSTLDLLQACYDAKQGEPDDFLLSYVRVQKSSQVASQSRVQITQGHTDAIQCIRKLRQNLGLDSVLVSERLTN